MKKIILLIAGLMCLYLTLAQAQRPPKRYLDVNAGIGLLPTFLKDGGEAVVVPLIFSADLMIADRFSLGMRAGYSVTDSGTRSFADGTAARWTHTFSMVSVRAGAHSSLLSDRWNIYGGMSVGYAMSDIEMMEGEVEKVRDTQGIGRQGNRAVVTGFLGTRYKITDRMGVYGELSIGTSLLTIGGSVRIY